MKAVVCSLFLVFTTTVTGAQERRSPPVDVPIISRNEKGDNELTVIYHSSGTCDIAATRGGQWHCSWTLKPNGEFCFAQDGGADKGKLICKQQRLIGRVNLDGTPLSYSQSCPQMDRRNPASKSAIQSVVVGHTLRTDLGDLTQHFMAYFTYGSDGAYT